MNFCSVKFSWKSLEKRFTIFYFYIFVRVYDDELKLRFFEWKNEWQKIISRLSTGNFLSEIIS